MTHAPRDELIAQLGPIAYNGALLEETTHDIAQALNIDPKSAGIAFLLEPIKTVMKKVGPPSWATVTTPEVQDWSGKTKISMKRRHAIMHSRIIWTLQPDDEWIAQFIEFNTGDVLNVTIELARQYAQALEDAHMQGRRIWAKLTAAYGHMHGYPPPLQHTAVEHDHFKHGPVSYGSIKGEWPWVAKPTP